MLGSASPCSPSLLSVASLTTEATPQAEQTNPILSSRLQKSLASLEEAKVLVSSKTASYGPFGSSVLDPDIKVKTKVRGEKGREQSRVFVLAVLACMQQSGVVE